MGVMINRRRVMGGKASNPFIQFADPGTKAVCVRIFGSDGEVTYEQASLPTIFHQTFWNNNTMGSFDECRFFVNVKRTSQAFFNNSITSIILPPNLEVLGAQTFQRCHSLRRIVMPASLLSIGEKAFYGDGSIVDFIILATIPPTLHKDAFLGITVTTIQVPAESVEAYKAASGWSKYASKIVAIEE